MASLRLENAEFLERLERGHSLLQGLADGLPPAGLFEGSSKHILFHFPRNHAHAIQVAENDIAGFDARTRHLDRHAVVHHLSARALVLRVASMREGGKTEVQDAPGIAGIAVYHDSRGAAMDGAGAHQFAPQRVARGASRADVDLVGFQAVRSEEHTSE